MDFTSYPCGQCVSYLKMRTYECESCWCMENVFCEWIGSSKNFLIIVDSSLIDWLMSLTSLLQIISSHEFSQDMLDEKLKENERRRRKAVKNVDLEMSQYLEDERLAIALQNSEFLQELRGNEDFMKTLEKGIWILLLFDFN